MFNIFSFITSVFPGPVMFPVLMLQCFVICVNTSGWPPWWRQHILEIREQDDHPEGDVGLQVAVRFLACQSASSPVSTFRMQTLKKLLKRQRRLTYPCLVRWLGVPESFPWRRGCPPSNQMQNEALVSNHEIDTFYMRAWDCATAVSISSADCNQTCMYSRGLPISKWPEQASELAMHLLMCIAFGWNKRASNLAKKFISAHGLVICCHCAIWKSEEAMNSWCWTWAINDDGEKNDHGQAN